MDIQFFTGLDWTKFSKCSKSVSTATLTKRITTIISYWLVVECRHSVNLGMEPLSVPGVQLVLALHTLNGVSTLWNGKPHGGVPYKESYCFDLLILITRLLLWTTSTICSTSWNGSTLTKWRWNSTTTRWSCCTAWWSSPTRQGILEGLILSYIPLVTKPPTSHHQGLCHKPSQRGRSHKSIGHCLKPLSPQILTILKYTPPPLDFQTNIKTPLNKVDILLIPPKITNISYIKCYICFKYITSWSLSSSFNTLELKSEIINLNLKSIISKLSKIWYPKPEL